MADDTTAHEATLRAYLDLHVKRRDHDVIDWLADDNRRRVELTRTQLRAVLDENARMREERAEFVNLLGWHVDAEDDPCHLDHHGYCQAHGSFTEGPCRTAAGRQLLARVRTDAVPQQPARGTACVCGCGRPDDDTGMCHCPTPCPCEPDCAFCLVPNPMREHAPGGEAL